jgi:hypothetical protein
MPAAEAEAYILDVQRLLLMANPPAPNVGIWRLFIDESGTKSNDFCEIDEVQSLITQLELFQTAFVAVGLNNTVRWVLGIPNRSKGIITAWSSVRPGGNETETGISPEIAPSPAHREHS